MAEKYSPPIAIEGDFDFRTTGYSPSSPLAADFDFGVFIFNVLAGSSNIFTAIWADTNAGRANGKMYALSWGEGTGLSILSLDTKILYDQYTITDGGRAEETLTNTDTKDLNVDTP